MEKTTKKPERISLKTTLSAADAKQLREEIVSRNWNLTKAGVFIGVSPSVLDSAINGRSIRIISAEVIKSWLKKPQK